MRESPESPKESNTLAWDFLGTDHGQVQSKGKQSKTYFGELAKNPCTGLTLGFVGPFYIGPTSLGNTHTHK